jgi:hypothetical protein
LANYAIPGGIDRTKKKGYLAKLANSLERRLEQLLDGLSHYTSECDGKYLEHI